MANRGMLLKLTRANLDVAFNTMKTEIAKLEGGFLSEILSDKSLAEGGEIWEGEGCNNFVAEINGPIQSEITDLAMALNTLISTIETAAVDVETKDQTLVADVEALRSECATIYN